MPHTLNLALVTEEAAGIRLLRSLSTGPHPIRYVFCKPPEESQDSVSVWSIAQDLGLHTRPVHQLKQPDTARELKAANIDLLISVRSPAILSKDIIACARVGAFNLHTGPLPAYAGRNVISWAIFNGETSHGVTLHQLTEEIDGGDIIYQARFPIAEYDTALDLTGRCIKEGIALVDRLIEQAALAPGSLPHRCQDKTCRHYYDQSIPNNGRIDWNWSAKQIRDFARACYFYPLPSPWGYPLAKMDKETRPVLSVHLTGLATQASPGTLELTSDQQVLIACADEWLAIDEVILNGSAERAYQALAT